MAQEPEECSMKNGHYVPWSELRDRRPPLWTCVMWEELERLKGVAICLTHDKALDIVALNGVSRICGIGAETDPYEFSAKIHRDMIKRGVEVAPLTFWEDV
jgi:hypothetical protein